jgi:hypothetical protein
MALGVLYIKYDHIVLLLKISEINRNHIWTELPEEIIETENINAKSRGVLSLRTGATRSHQYLMPLCMN